MAGTINLALTQQFDMDDRPLSGGLLYFFAAGTSTPQNAFKDVALTLPHPNPIVLLADGRVPMFYLADGSIKIRLTSKTGVTILAEDNLLVIGPSAGGGGGPSVDATTVLATGDMKARFGTGTLAGFVRCNGNTIGNSTSGATERANADCQALFEYLWATNAVAITPTRGASANADWLANRQAATPDLRGRTIAGMDDMGATAASRLTASFFGVAGNALGNAGGDEKHSLVSANLPTYTPAGSIAVSSTGTASYQPVGTVTVSISGISGTVSQPGITISGGTVGGTAASGLSNIAAGSSPTLPTTATTISAALASAPTFTFSSGTATGSFVGGTVSYSFTGTTLNASGPTAHATAMPAMVMTLYIKL